MLTTLKELQITIMMEFVNVRRKKNDYSLLLYLRTKQGMFMFLEVEGGSGGLPPRGVLLPLFRGTGKIQTWIKLWHPSWGHRPCPALAFCVEPVTRDRPLAEAGAMLVENGQSHIGTAPLRIIYPSGFSMIL